MKHRADKAYSKGMNHRLEPKVDLLGADDLSDILDLLASWSVVKTWRFYTGIVGLQQSNLEAFFLKVPLSLS